MSLDPASKCEMAPVQQSNVIYRTLAALDQDPKRLSTRRELSARSRMRSTSGSGARSRKGSFGRGKRLRNRGVLSTLHCIGRWSAVAASRRDCDRGTILKGGRREEALKSVRQQSRERLKFGGWRDLADGAGLRDAPNPIGRDWR